MKNLLLIIFCFPYFYVYPGEYKKIAIIGGGMAGVSTAAFLKNSTFEVHLFEKEDHLGGHARTVSLKGLNGKEVKVDLGPQYFAEGGWNLYIDFLKYFKLFQENRFYKFTSGTSIFKDNQKYPNFITPSLDGESFDWLINNNGLSRMMAMLVFLGKANKFYEEEDKENISIGEFLKKIDFPDEFRDGIIRPLLATSVNSSLENVDDCSIITSSGLLAFRGPLSKAEFFVSKNGLQPFIEKIAEKIQKNWKDFHLHLSTPVDSILKNPDGTLKVIYGGEELNVDYVIFATHPYVAEKLLKDWDEFKSVAWEDFTYANTKVVIHDDRSYLHPVYQSFYNIKIRNDGEYYLAMNLQKISANYGDLIKSWNLSEEEYLNLKKNGHILAESYFKHPTTTTKFIDRIREIKQIAKDDGRIFFAGGWSLNWENQNTAVKSGFLAAGAIDPNIIFKWKKRLPSLNH